MHNTKKWFLLILCLMGLSVLLTSVSLAQTDTEEEAASSDLEEVLQGHSIHGEAFNEGPRQAAYLMKGTGDVQFEITTKSEEAQAFFNQGVGQLHGFWYLEAERSFRQAAAIDPDCAMAYWGAAQAAYSNRKRAAGFMEKAVELKDNVTDREKMYIDSAEAFFKGGVDSKELKSEKKKDLAQKYLKALESIVLEYPDDIEAKAFVAHRIWHNGRDGIPVSSYLATDALINSIYAVAPNHPSHHYTIHLWDYRKPEKALASAAACGPAAPGIAHMWHMPGHIYSRLKRYEDAVYQQEASARVDHAHMMRDGVIPDEISNFAHNNEWLIRNLSFIGRVDDGIDLAVNMCSLPRHPRYNTLEKRGSSNYGRRRLLQLLREYEMYEQAIEFTQTGYLQSPDNESEQLKVWRLLACSAAITNRSELTDTTVAKIETLRDKHQAEMDRLQPIKDRLEKAKKVQDREGDDLPPAPLPAGVDLETLKDDLAKTRKDFSASKSLVSQCKKALLAVEGYSMVAEMEFGAARQKLKEAAGEDLSWVGELHYLAGEYEKAIEAIEKQIDRRKKEVIPLARLVHIKHLEYLRHGAIESSEDEKIVDKEALAEAFEKLRDSSSSMDLSAKIFERLNPVAELFGHEAGAWNKARTMPDDLGGRPSLDSLGPFRWAPSAAPSWSLVDSDEVEVRSSEFIGRPYIAIFYLGHGCLHCAEQLQAFGPHVIDFKAAGIELVAISSDDRKGLAKSIEDFNGSLPYRYLLSDEGLGLFKQFRAFDDFEDQPLHGTFLVDGKGRIRWQDISYEPFMDHEFLLKEAKRLLDQEKSQPELTSK